MPRYFFDVQDGLDHRDEIGREVWEQQTLRSEALQVMSAMVAKEGNGSGGFAAIVSVRDATDTVVLTLRTVCQFDESAVRPPQAES